MLHRNTFHLSFAITKIFQIAQVPVTDTNNLYVYNIS
jgi:hypothetical protein